MIEVSNLTKRYGCNFAVEGLTFDVKPGEIVGFLGPNGAGKTTTMRILSCFIPATGGTASVCGLDVFRDSLEVRRRIGYLPEHIPLYTDMRVEEYLRYRGRLKGLRGKRLRERADDVMQACELGTVRRTVIGRLSRGYRQRVGLADTLIHEPEVLILDEPTIGLDPNQIRHIRTLIKGLARRHTVLLSSHILSEVEMMCERVLIINQGRIVASDSPGNLKGLLKGNQQFGLQIQGPARQIAESLRAIEGVVSVGSESVDGWEHVSLECRKGGDIRESVFRLAVDRGWVIRELRQERTNLEDVFVALTSSRAGEGSE